MIEENAFSDKNVGDCWAISHEIEDPGGKPLLTCYMPAHPEVKLHENNRQLVDRLVACFNSREVKEKHVKMAHIVGHGNMGHMCTGPTCDAQKNDMLAPWNANLWKEDFKRLRGMFTLIRLYGCHTGAGTDGLHLLHDLCEATDTSCQASPNMVYCVNGQAPLDTEWITVYPGQKLRHPVDQFTSRFTPTPRIDTIKIFISKKIGYLDIPLEIIDEIEITTLPDKKTSNIRHDLDKSDFLQAIDFGSPEFIPNTFTACRTGTITITFKELPIISTLVGQKLILNVWNSVLIEDSMREGYFYYPIKDIKKLYRI